MVNKIFSLIVLMGLGIASITGCGPSRKVYMTGSQASTAPTPTGDASGGTTITLNYRGNYDASQTYKAGDVVFFEGHLYFALHDDPGALPGSGWHLFDGLQGPEGPQGPAGPAGADGVSIITTQIIILDDGSIWWPGKGQYLPTQNPNPQ